MLKLMVLLIASQGQGHILHSWLNRQKLVRLMNDWTELRRNIRKQLQTDTESTQRPFYKESNVVTCCTILHALLHLVVGLTIATFTPVHPHRNLELTYLTLMICYFTFSELLLDAKVPLIFNELRANFTQVCKRI